MRTLGLALGLSALATSPSSGSPETLFGLMSTGQLFASADAGGSWSVRSRLPVRDAVGLVRGTAPAELTLVSRAGGIFVSADAGTTWAAVATVAASDIVAADVRIRPDLSLLLLTAAGTVWESADGVTFRALATFVAPRHVGLTHDTRGTQFALTETGTVRASEDGGATWAARGAIPISDGVGIQAIGSDLFVLTGAGDVWTSRDAGTSWAAAGTLSQVHMRGIVRGGNGVLYASTREGEVAASADGTSWTWVGLMNQLGVLALATDSPPAGTSGFPPTFHSVSLSPPRPNPRRGDGGSLFRFTLPSPATVSFFLYEVGGRLAATRPPERFSAGAHSVAWNPDVRVSGAYYVRLRTDAGRSAGTRWVLLR